jgi:hypothetical protein
MVRNTTVEANVLEGPFQKVAPKAACILLSFHGSKIMDCIEVEISGDSLHVWMN